MIGKTATHALSKEESERMAGLREYGLLPTESGELPALLHAGVASALEDLVLLATSVCGAPFAVVNVITADQQVQIAAAGTDAMVCSRGDSMCADVFLSGQTTLVKDASLDPRFADNPFVTGELGEIRAYASVPLEAPSGLIIGSLCLFSMTAELPSSDQTRMLEVFAHQVMEILELQHRTLQLDEALSALRRSNAALTEFAGRVSHDLRAPLTTILGYVELAELDPNISADHALAEYLNVIGSGGRRMLGTLEDVLSYSRADGGLKRDSVSLLEITQDAAHDLGLTVGSDSLSSPAVCSDAVIYADRVQLRALLQNLLANSLNYPSPERSLQVSIAADFTSAGATVRVADNGKGIRPEDREKALEPLVRLHRPGDGAGSGLGLATCSRIAQAHGGELTIEDTPGGGTTVSVFFPAIPQGNPLP